MNDEKDGTYQIEGRVTDAEHGRGVAGLRVEAWDKDLFFDDLVGQAVTDEAGRFRIVFDESYYREGFFDRNPDLFFKVFSGDELLANTQDSVEWNPRAGSRPVEIAVPWRGGNAGGGGGGNNGAGLHSVAGAVASPDRAGVGGLRVEIVDRNVGRDVKLAEAQTDERGRYKATYSPSALGKKAQPDLQARVYAGDTFVAASEVRFNAGVSETINVALPANSVALPSEHETLTKALASHFGGELRELQETDERQDITYLARKTGWDARAVALAALADQFSRGGTRGANDAGIAPAFYYALFRAGLPANSDALYRADAQTVAGVWRQAVEQGVLPRAAEGEIDRAVESFRRLSAENLLTAAPAAGVSNVKEMLSAADLDEGQQRRFAELYTAHREDAPKFWEEVAGALGRETADRLQLDGKLGFLTLNNAPLVRALRGAAQQGELRDTVELAQGGYFRAEKWEALLADGVPVPKEIPGESAAEKRQNYAEYLAAQVRLSYPTVAVAEMVGAGELAVERAPEVRTFLTEHQGRFEIGMGPVGQYVARNRLDVPAETVEQITRLQRTYQITPSDQAMAGLLRTGMDSAYRVASQERGAFIESFADALGGAQTAAQTHDRAVQVHNVTLNIAISYLTARNGFELGARQMGSDDNDLGQMLRPRPRGVADNAGDVIAYPTLEGLFGEMDYCACDHCRSILSPAAYLVDLLHFIDRPAGEIGKQNPQRVFFDRRPDVQHLPLTCENTNTALPYIDVVNETLEYFIANTTQALSLEDYTGHDTGDAASADLLASPQYVIDSAYQTLRGQRFPPPLPFHQPLENLRRYFDKFEVPLPLAMERLRKNDALERGANAYGWRDIWMEELRLSRAEYEILTDSGAVSLRRMYGFPAGTTEPAVVAALSNAKQFTRRLGLTYEELVAILKTRFVNPNSDLVPKLERLGVPFVALKALKDNTITGAQFDALLPTGALAPDPAAYGGDIKAWVRNDENYDRVMSIITLADPSAEPDPCSFDSLEFRFARPMDGVGDTSTRIGAVEFVRLLRFIRLWRKLGWTIEQTDAAVCALFPVPPFPAAAAAIDTVAELDAGFRALLPRLGIIARVMRELNLNAKRDLLPLLALWSPLGTYGEASLYRQMFLSPAMLKQDAAFADNGYGEYLRDNTQKLVGHAGALRAAFGLTGEELSHILAALGFDADTSSVAYTHPQPTLGQTILDTAPGIGYDNAANLLTFKGALTAEARDALKALAGTGGQFDNAVDALYAANQAALTGLTLDNLSAVFRRGWLARKLKISVRELLLLTTLTSLDPFATPDPTAPALLRLIELVKALKERSLKSSAALYLIWNQDLSGKSAPDPAQVLEFARTLRGDFAGIDDQFAAVEDPAGNLARTRMALVYGSEPADAFFALLEDTIVLDVPYTHTQPTLGAAITAADARLGYDDFRHRLTRTGLLTATTRDALTGLAGVSADFQAAVLALFALGEDARGSFFTRHPELEPLYTAYVTSPAPLEEKRAALLAAFRPELARRRKRQQALQRLSAAANTTLDFTRAVLDPPAAPFPLHAEGQPARPALDDVLALDRAGLAAQFFFRDTATGAIDQSVAAAANLDYAAGGGNTLPANTAVPGAAVSGIWSGLVETPEAGFYNFVVEADAGATVTLSLGGQARALTQNGKVWRNTQPLELAAGALYEIVITVNRVRDTVAVRWETPKRPREVIPARYLYPAAVFPPFIAVYVRFLKAASLAQGLRLTAAEFTHFATHADYRIAGDNWPNLLPVTGPPAPAVAAALLAPLAALLHFARIKSELSPDDESLLSVLRDPAAATADADGLLFKLTRWDKKSLDDLLVHFGLTVAGLSQLAQFRRVHDAFALTVSMGIPAAALIQATTNEPTADTVRALQAALRARYEAEDWRTVVQPINDELRALQRDALVAHILHQMRAQPATEHIDTADKLFEYFLMDVQMEPCMQTSRIRHALSSVQLFIERCLMNLEPRVSPAALDAKQWEWMKRYRVWEANRKVFLFPENWLEPELRDNKSPFFKEVESELLQSDITEDTATVALLNYLAKLEEIAKLEPCGIYHVEADAALQRNELDHVIARTTGAGRKYYYRRREGGNWTPWEQIKLDIEDNPVVPVVWRGRLLLFWVRLQKQSQTDPTKLKTSQNTANLASATVSGIQSDARQNAQENARVTVKAVLCWSEYYNGKWQAAKTSDVDRPTEITWFTSPDDFDRANLLLTSHEEGQKHHLRVSIEREGYSTFLLYNTHGLPEREEDNSHVVGDMFIGPRWLDTHLAAFRIEYYIFEDSALGKAGTTHKRPLLTNPFHDYTVETQHPVKDIWAAPFFYGDPLHLFYVRTEHETTPFQRQPGYGVEFKPGRVYEIPPLVLEREPRGPRPPWEEVGPHGPDDYRVVNPADLARFVTEDAHIRRGIAATGSVEFDGKRIGPKGALSEHSVKM